MSKPDLAHIPLFSRLSGAEQEKLGSLMVRKTFKANTAVFFQDDPSDSLYVVLSGSAKVFSLMARLWRSLARPICLRRHVPVVGSEGGGVAGLKRASRGESPFPQWSRSPGTVYVRRPFGCKARLLKLNSCRLPPCRSSSFSPS